MCNDDIKKIFHKKEIKENLDECIMIESDLYTQLKYLKDIDYKISDIDAKLKKIILNDKKNDKYIEMLNDKIEKKENDMYMIEKNIKKEQKENIKKYKKIIEILDEIDNIYKYAKMSENNDLKNNIDLVYKKINRYISDIGIEEIKSENEIMNPKLHECVAIENINKFDSPKVVDNEIVSVIKKGYKVNDEVYRPAKVVIAKEEK